MRLRQQMRARRGAAVPPAEIAALRDELSAVRAEVAALRAALSGPRDAPADDVAPGYLAWRGGPLLALAKLLTRRGAPGEPPAPARGNAMHALCRVLLTGDADDRHQRLGDTVTALVGDPAWRNDVTVVRALIDARDGAAPLAGAVSPDEWVWPAPGVPVDPARHEVLAGSAGTRVAAVAAPGLRAVPPLVVATTAA